MNNRLSLSFCLFVCSNLFTLPINAENEVETKKQNFDVVHRIFETQKEIVTKSNSIELKKSAVVVLGSIAKLDPNDYIGANGGGELNLPNESINLLADLIQQDDLIKHSALDALIASGISSTESLISIAGNHQNSFIIREASIAQILKLLPDIRTSTKLDAETKKKIYGKILEGLFTIITSDDKRLFRLASVNGILKEIDSLPAADKTMKDYFFRTLISNLNNIIAKIDQKNVSQLYNRDSNLSQDDIYIIKVLSIQLSKMLSPPAAAAAANNNTTTTVVTQSNSAVHNQPYAATSIPTATTGSTITSRSTPTISDRMGISLTRPFDPQRDRGQIFVPDNIENNPPAAQVGAHSAKGGAGASRKISGSGLPAIKPIKPLGNPSYTLPSP